MEINLNRATKLLVLTVLYPEFHGFIMMFSLVRGFAANHHDFKCRCLSLQSIVSGNFKLCFLKYQRLPLQSMVPGDPSPHQNQIKQNSQQAVAD